MKKALFCSLFALLLAVAPKAHAQQPPFMMTSANCVNSPDFGMMPLCFDTGKNVWTYWTGTAFAALPGSSETFNWTDTLGAFTNTAVMPIIAPCTGHFTKLVCTATLTGACTTGPTINVGDVTGSTTGTGVSPTTTVATLASASETLAFTSGDTIAMEQTASTGTCTAPHYACSATYTCP